eukprot:TRINITY_DN2298_c0_g1_i1.p1 TRINITY_DN2298_c0_g1~~TRINITY_DN2298_c0_g1_i1.p1  ORF type:complete len:381 (+),score=36.23 TRINITY_DN2298_c0_g1_i1:76-1218(+)
MEEHPLLESQSSDLSKPQFSRWNLLRRTQSSQTPPSKKDESFLEGLDEILDIPEPVLGAPQGVPQLPDATLSPDELIYNLKTWDLINVQPQQQCRQNITTSTCSGGDTRERSIQDIGRDKFLQLAQNDETEDLKDETSSRASWEIGLPISMQFPQFLMWGNSSLCENSIDNTVHACEKPVSSKSLFVRNSNWNQYNWLRRDRLVLVGASVSGAVAGGIVAGPLGVAIGYKSGAALVLAGSAVSTMAYHVYACKHDGVPILKLPYGGHPHPHTPFAARQSPKLVKLKLQVKQDHVQVQIIPCRRDRVKTGIKSHQQQEHDNKSVVNKSVQKSFRWYRKQQQPRIKEENKPTKKQEYNNNIRKSQQTHYYNEIELCRVQLQS